MSTRDTGTGWDVATWVLIAFGATFGALSLASAVAVMAGATGPAALLLDLVTSAAMFGLGIANLVWLYSTRKLVAGHGDSSRRVAHGLVRVWALAFFFSVMLGVVGGGNRTLLVIGMLLRVGGAAALVAGVLIVRSRVLRLLAAPPATMTDMVPAQRSVPSPMLPSPVPTRDDWNAGLWDPDIQAEIDRRRHRS